ncbi:hypothetical protein [Cohaesibacter celericrescens]|uniref:Uncharacterized protein n=1 Tax=Cohaesibacter celericrescens TaxID=2067669 RepID=A0A2N5XX84_9HYPH|nr:hypothetical protein [Cohaesibacter celericrescens]PLW79067.1 hypothetical protein C0081_02215 [Cohaesibacter celericrescens]
MATLEERAQTAISNIEASASIVESVVEGPPDGPDSLISTSNGKIKSLLRVQAEINHGLVVMFVDESYFFPIPEDVVRLEYLAVIGASGGGASLGGGAADGGDGGVTSFGSIVSISGGKGGKTATARDETDHTGVVTTAEPHSTLPGNIGGLGGAIFGASPQIAGDGGAGVMAELTNVNISGFGGIQITIGAGGSGAGGDNPGQSGQGGSVILAYRKSD